MLKGLWEKLVSSNTRTKKSSLDLLPWAVGQHVSYVLRRADQSWVSMHMSVAQQEEDSFIVVLRAKEETVQTMNIIRTTLHLPIEHDEHNPPFQLLKGMLLQGDESEQSHYVASHLTLALNLLLIQNFENVPQVLSAPPQESELPCDITKSYPLTDPWPEFGYEKIHSLSPRVPITGVARSIIDGDEGSLLATAFAYRAESPGGFEDYVDWSFAQTDTFGAFLLDYPSTWFFDTDTSSRDDLSRFWLCLLGGVTEACIVQISLYDEGPEVLEGVIEEMVREFWSTRELNGGQVFAARDERPLHVGERLIVHRDFEAGAIDGLSLEGLYVDRKGSRAAHISAFMCIAKENPRHDEEIAAAQRCFYEMLRSFLWTHAA